MDTVVVGSTKKNLQLTITDENNVAVDLTSGSVELRGESSDTPNKTIHVAGTLTSPANGVALWAQIGTFIGGTDLGDLLSTTYTLRVKFTDAAGKFDYGPAFQIAWLAPPIKSKLSAPASVEMVADAVLVI